MTVLNQKGPSSWHWLVGGAALVIILAGLQAVSGIVNPLLLAAFLAIASATPLNWMQRRGVPAAVAVMILFLGVGLVFFLLFLALRGAVETMAAQAPQYQEQLTVVFGQVRDYVVAMGVPPEALPEEVPLPAVGTLTDAAATIASGIGQFTAATFLVLLAFMFLLLEESTLPGKLSVAFPASRRARVRTRRFLHAVDRYIFIKSATSTLTGVIIGTGLWLIGVDFPILWGILAGLLNFIPTVGSIIAAAPAVVVALLGGGLLDAVLTVVLYVAVNVAIGSITEPRLMGRTLGLSPLVVLISLMVWGWVFGPVGMLLSIPLTMIAKLALEAQPETRWIAVLLSDRADERIG
ncbi:MAG: AI-2E family transporter [Halorhodospira halophila]|uniref:AI-2E family transporter n=1 Tax=Halorhodospira TaxID=85108 RepID=UPI001913F1EC|nr:AI-2E family transporter [Halorhodospira halophila]MCG5532329.1 AI-2E family transporter [Halorhodospira sp. 9621]MCG5538035.1 AI-2E family transporter [Halorhodospira sp. 9622]MCG5541271.1 AI-2E family transporter [Halorhodospira sp. M39old]MCG5542621.1 AI-2E family transporter [Halorhodospira sp. 9628]MCG5546489.1 AI-2E family transporter [Halorhodospira sp. M38]